MARRLYKMLDVVKEDLGNVFQTLEQSETRLWPAPTFWIKAQKTHAVSALERRHH
jgi:hypothetical protein